MPARRQSKNRNAILELVRASKTHPTARWVYEELKPRLPCLSLGTVYRNLKIMLEEGIISSTGVINGEECFDGVSTPHLHAVCTVCGTIRDLPEKTETEIYACFYVKIPDFAIDIRSTVFYGLCNSCESGGSKSDGYKAR